MSRPTESSAMFWSAADVMLRQGLQFGVSILLARLLEPEAFGVLALVTTMTALAGALVESGLSAALIQKQDASIEDESTVFWFNLATAILLAAALSLSASTIAALFRIPGMSAMVPPMALVLVINAAGTVQNTLLAKNLRFKSQTRAGVVSLVVSGSVAVGLARAGLGVWALVGQAVSAATANTISLWALSAWRPAFVFRVASLRSLLRFGSYMLMAGVVDTLAYRSSSLALGWFHTARDLGFYMRAETTAQVAPSVIQRIVPRVTFSSFSVLASDTPQLRDSVRTALAAVSSIAVPTTLGISALAEPLVLTLFGSVWSPAIAALRLLALTGLAVPSHVVNVSALMSLGRSDVLFWMHLVKKAIGVAFIALAAPLDSDAMALAVLAASVIAMMFDSIVPGRYIGYSASEQARDGWRVWIAGIVMACAVLGFVQHGALSPLPKLLAGTALGGVVYVLLVAILQIHPAVDWLHAAIGVLRPGGRRQNDQPQSIDRRE